MHNAYQESYSKCLWGIKPLSEFSTWCNTHQSAIAKLFQSVAGHLKYSNRKLPAGRSGVNSPSLEALQDMPLASRSSEMYSIRVSFVETLSITKCPHQFRILYDVKYPKTRRAWFCLECDPSCWENKSSISRRCPSSDVKWPIIPQAPIWLGVV